MKTVKVHDAGCAPHTAVTGEGVTIAAAVRHAAGKLFALPGRSLGHERVSTHEHLWTWRIGDVVRELVVHESRSGLSGKGSKRQVQLRLTDRDAERLDALAEGRGLDRSACVVALVDEAVGYEPGEDPKALVSVLRSKP